MYAMFKYTYIATLMHKDLNAITNAVSETGILRYDVLPKPEQKNVKMINVAIK